MLDQIEKMYGIGKEAFADFIVYAIGREIYVAGRDAFEFSERLKARKEGTGIMLGRNVMGQFKLTTNAIQIFGKHATKRVVEIDGRQAAEFAAGNMVKADCKEIGYVIVRSGNDYLGCGYSRGNGEIESLVPKKRRLAVQEMDE